MKSALSVDEWKERSFRFEYYGEAKAHSDGGLTVRDDINRPAILRAEERHKLAALALDGQPFGFTREDVRFLRQCARDEVNGTNGDVNKYAADRANSIADRIEALLPPVTP